MGGSINVKRLISLVIIIGVITFIYSVLYNIFCPAHKFPLAVRGNLDLSGWNFKEEGSVDLTGEWEFYPGSLLLPSELNQTIKKYGQVPGSWSRKLLFDMPVRGCGTYRLKITLPEESGKLLIKIQNIWMAHCIYLNGIQVKESGKVTDSEAGYLALNTPYMMAVNPVNTLDIVIQVANYTYYDGGIIAPLQLGPMSQMEVKNRLYFGLDLAGLFLFLTFGVFYLHLYRMRDKEVSYLYSGLYLILLAFITITSGEKLFMRLLPSLPFDVAYKFQDFVARGGFPVLILFLRSVEPKVMGHKLMMYILSPVLLYFVLIILTPLSFHSTFLDEICLYQNIIMLSCVGRLFYILVRNENRGSPFNEFTYIVTSFVFVTLLQFNEGLIYLGIVHNNAIGKISSFGFLFSLNVVLARRYTSKLEEAQILSRELKLSNEILNDCIDRMTLMQVQMKPHFIYNTLNNIIALCYEDSEKAANLVYLLSTYLRHVFLTDQPGIKIPVTKELELIHTYIEIEKLRFGDRLNYKTNIDTAIYMEQIMIPALIIQPLVENAVVHGLFNKPGRGTVRLTVTEGDYFIKVMVEDDGTGMDDDRLYQILNEDTCTGFGIKNIRKRLVAIPKASFSIDSELEKGTRCILYLPKEKELKGVD